MAAALGLLAFTAAASAQDQGQDQAQSDAPPPPGAAQQFGPRAGGAGAPGGGAPQLKTEEIAKHGAWSVQCTELPPGVDEAQPKGGKSCGMVLIAKSEKNPNLAMSIVVSKIKQGDKSAVFMRVLAPIGVYLPTGIPIEIDGNALPKPMQFTRCNPRLCEGFGEASPDSLAKFKKGTDATFYIYDRPGNGYPMKVPLEGFGASLADLDKL